jgi:hypothetical protein
MIRCVTDWVAYSVPCSLQCDIWSVAAGGCKHVASRVHLQQLARTASGVLLGCSSLSSVSSWLYLLVERHVIWSNVCVKCAGSLCVSVVTMQAYQCASSDRVKLCSAFVPHVATCYVAVMLLLLATYHIWILFRAEACYVVHTMMSPGLDHHRCTAHCFMADCHGQPVDPV